MCPARYCHALPKVSRHKAVYDGIEAGLDVWEALQDNLKTETYKLMEITLRYYEKQWFKLSVSYR